MSLRSVRVFRGPKTEVPGSGFRVPGFNNSIHAVYSAGIQSAFIRAIRGKDFSVLSAASGKIHCRFGCGSPAPGVSWFNKIPLVAAPPHLENRP